MSDNIKLVIEIPKSDYKAICENKEDAIIAHDTCRRIAKNGIPLDDVKAEIRELRDSWEKDCYHDEAEALNIALKIIDKHIGKAESEDKE